MRYKDKNLMTPFAKALVFLLVLVMLSSSATASSIGGSKNTLNGQDYELGDTIQYEMTVINTNTVVSGIVNTVTVYDDFPNGTTQVLQANLVQNPQESETYHASYTVTQADVDAGTVKNRLRAEGIDSEQDDVRLLVEKTSQIVSTPQEVPPGDEFWATEWFQTYPDQYTQFVLPSDQKYLTTLSWFAPESSIHLWDNDVNTPLAAWEGERVKFIHDPANRQDDLYLDSELETVRVHGTFGEGPGNHTFVDPETGLKPENKPYTNPIAPTYPQADEAPMKDHITFNPAIMEHNDRQYLWYSELDFGVNFESEKVFKRMSYEKDWFKDHNTNGCFDVVFTSGSSEQVVCLDNEDEVHDLLAAGWEMEIWNNNPSVGGQTADIYGPAIIQDFTYMFLSDSMPTPVVSGSTVLIPMASNQSGNGIDSFIPNPTDYLNRQEQGVKVESEETLGLDIDGDGVMEPMDADGIALSGDETVVLVLEKQGLQAGRGSVQFFDHVIEVSDVFSDNGADVIFRVSDNEGPYYNEMSIVPMRAGDVAYFYRAKEGGSPTEAPAFYLKLDSADTTNNRAIFEVGRMFGQAGANIAANKYHSQKVFWVDEVMYNTAAIKAYVDNEVKYITIRQKLPKFDIKVHDILMKTWLPGDLLPELPPFNMNHKVHDDIQKEWTHDAMGPIRSASPLEIIYTDEQDDERFRGELKEIYNETGDDESWMIEWFNTMPWQYTEFHIHTRYDDELWLFTGAFVAPESTIHMWDQDTSMFTKKGERVKFWFDDSYDPLYIDDGELRVYGTFGEGPGDHDFVDPVTDLKPENKPYTDPMGPFYPQSEQAPVKDHVTFNPAYMDHNEHGPNGDTANFDFSWYSELDFGVNFEGEKVFKRMSYEKEWFKDHNTNGCYDVVMSRGSSKQVVCLDNEDEIHNLMETGWTMDIHNNDGTVNGEKADIYGPAIIQDFTYMFLDDQMPTPIRSGSTVLIPMASYQSGNGIDSFAPHSNQRINKGVQVESEETLNLDIDGDGVKEPMDADGKVLSGDETVVLVLRNEYLPIGATLQFFDHQVKLNDVFNSAGATAIFNVADNEGNYYNEASTVTMQNGDVKYFYRGKEGGSPTEAPAFYLKLVAADTDNNRVIIEVGRMFGQAGANIAANPYHSQKVFWVDNVMYNTVAVKAYVDNEVKYITFRQKLPKMNIKIHDIQMKTWLPGMTLPELPPFNMPHVIHDDVQYTQGHDKIGDKMYVGPLVISYSKETTEPRYHGEIKEVYWEVDANSGAQEPTCTGELTGDGTVDIDDLFVVLNNWGLGSGSGELTGDGTVDIDDLFVVLNNWGPCQT